MKRGGEGRGGGGGGGGGLKYIHSQCIATISTSKKPLTYVQLFMLSEACAANAQWSTKYLATLFLEPFIHEGVA